MPFCWCVCWEPDSPTMLRPFEISSYGLAPSQAVHNVMRMAVLCKQNSDPAHAAKLHSALEECWKLYDAYALH